MGSILLELVESYPTIFFFIALPVIGYVLPIAFLLFYSLLDKLGIVNTAM
jgi:hypothetical protein